MSLDWYPIIDQEKCTECLICYDFCPHEVYILEDDKPIVTRPENCISRCHGCEKQCPSEAITYFGDDGKHSEGKAIRLPKL
ncbi:MAG: ferredoxin family protein [Ignavibacteriales bacterium]